MEQSLKCATHGGYPIQEGLIPADRPARTLWTCAERPDHSLSFIPGAAVEGHAGRPPLVPRGSPESSAAIWMAVIQNLIPG